MKIGPSLAITRQGRVAGGSGGVLETIDVSTMTAGGWKEVNLTDFSTVSVSSHNATFSGAGAANLNIQLGFNDGVSTTWYNTSGDYRVNAEHDTTSQVFDATEMPVLLGTALYGPTHYWEVVIDCLKLACPKPIVGTEFLSDPGGGSFDSKMRHALFTQPLVLNRMRIRSPSHAGTSGTIYAYKENRTQTLVATAGSSLTSGTQFDLTGSSSCWLMSNDFVRNGAGGITLRGRSGGTTITSAGSVDRVWEQGSTSSAAAGNIYVCDDNSPTSGTSKKFMCRLQNLNKSLPAISVAAEMLDNSNSMKWYCLSRHNSPIDGIETEFGGTGGTLYLVKDETPLGTIATISLSAMGADEEIDITGYKNVNFVSENGHTNIASDNTIVQNSANGGASYYTANGDYWGKYEKGATELQEASSAHLVCSTNGATATNRQFFAEMHMLGIAMPAFSRAFCLGGGNWKTNSIHLNPVVVNRLKISFGGGAVGASGTIYVTGEAS